MTSVLRGIEAKRESNGGYLSPRNAAPQIEAHFQSITRNPELGITIERGISEDSKGGDAVLVARAMKKLIDCYPDYWWRVEIDDRFFVGMVYILNLDINAALFGGNSYGYKLHLKAVQSDTNLISVMRAGGEILERARLTRGRNKGETPTLVDGVKSQHQPLIFH